MENNAYPLQLTGTGTTTPGGLTGTMLYGIAINKTLTGTLTVKEGSSAVGTFAATTAPGMYHLIPQGVRYYKLTLVLSAGDDVTAFVRPL